MTRSRLDVSASLASRGRPENWATEDEAAALSGMSRESFDEKLAALEARGFPRRRPDNNKRFIPHILRFWEADAETATFTAPPNPAQDDEDERNKERLGQHGRQSIRVVAGK